MAHKSSAIKNAKPAKIPKSRPISINEKFLSTKEYQAYLVSERRRDRKRG